MVLLVHSVTVPLCVIVTDVSTRRVYVTAGLSKDVALSEGITLAELERKGKILVACLPHKTLLCVPYEQLTLNAAKK